MLGNIYGILCCLFSFLLFYHSTLLAESSLLGLKNLGVTNATPANNKKEIPFPNLNQLDNNWWDYFANADETQRIERSQLFKAQIKALNYQEENKEALLERIDQWQKSFEKLKVAASTPLKETITTEAKRYTIEEVIAFNNELNTKQSNQQHLEKQIKQRQNNIDNLNKILQQMKLDYQNKDLLLPQRLNIALDWIKQRFSLATLENEQSAANLLLERLNQQVEYLAQQLAYARLHLDASAQINRNLLPSLKETKENIEKLNAEIESRQLDSVVIDEGNPEQLAANRLEDIKTLALRASLADQQLRAITQQTSIYLYQLADEIVGASSNYKIMREFITNSQKQLESIEKLLPEWQKYRTEENNAATTRLESNKNDKHNPMVKMDNELLKRLQDIQDQLAILGKSQRETLLLISLLQERVADAQGGALAAVSVVTDTAENVVQFSLDSLNSTLFEINDTPITALSIARFVLILFSAWIISRLFSGMLRRIGRIKNARSGTTEISSSLFITQRILFYLIMIIGFTVGLSSIGVDVSKFALIASALSIGIGFGLQNMINNFVSGIILLFEKSLKIGDFVELESGVVGEVREMRVRSTVVTTNDNIDIVVPNSEFVSGRVVNWTMRDARCRLRIPFRAAYHMDKALVRKVVLEAAVKIPFTLNNGHHRPQVWLVGFGENSLNFELVVWLSPDAVKRPASVQAVYCWEIHTALVSNHIEIPLPQRHVYIKKHADHIDPVNIPT